MNDTSVLHGPFWRVNIGQLVTGGVILIGFFVGFGRISEKFDTISNTVMENRTKIVTMDQNGTVASQRKLDMEGLQIVDHAARLTKIEDAISNIKVMQEQIARIGADVKEIKDGSNHTKQ